MNAQQSLQDVKNTLHQLPKEELRDFRAWYAEFDALAWDNDFEEDVRAGRLDGLAEEALREFSAGRSTPL